MVILSTEKVDFVDRKLFLRLLSIKSGVFVDGKLCLKSTDRKKAAFLARKAGQDAGRSEAKSEFLLIGDVTK